MSRAQDGELPILDLPTDHARPAVQTYQSGNCALKIESQLRDKLRALARREEVSFYTVLLAAFALLLARLSGQEEILVGVPTAGRRENQFQDVFGYFVNPVVVQGSLANAPFRTFLSQVRANLLGAIKHREYPFPWLVKDLQTERDTSRAPLFQVTFVLQKPQKLREETLRLVRGEQIQVADLHLSFTDWMQTVGNLDLMLDLIEQNEGLVGYFRYNRDIFDSGSIERMVGHFKTLLAGIVSNPKQRVHELPLLTEAEKQQLLVTWNNTQADFPKLCVHQLFEQQVARTPEATAVIFADQVVTYHELNVRANQLAHKLQSLGVGPNSLVGLCVENSLEMIVGLLGILKAGGAYVPLSPAYPPQRLRLMLESADLSVLLTQQHLRQSLPTNSAQVLCLDSDWAEIASQKRDNPETVLKLPSKLIYVIFTSGSTGQPKCAGVYHEGFTNLVCWFVNQFGLSATDKVLVTSSFSFDLTQKNFFAPLLVGGQLHLSADAPMGYKAMRQHISKHQITWLNCTPSAFYPFIDSEINSQAPIRHNSRPLADLASLRYLFLGGEPIEMSRLRPWLQSETCHATVVNTYGPTECTDVVSSYTIVESDIASDKPIPIGRPISNVNLYILNEERQPVPINVLGDLYIGGICVGAGYLNDKKQTNEKFVANPFTTRGGDEARLYKTGDLARWRADGNPQTRSGHRIEFLGRSDHQVKIRGFRIELGEIETLLSQHPAIRSAIVIVHERPDEHSEQLVAILVPQEAGLEPDTIRSYLKQKVPNYMVPQVFVILDHLPLTPNGKVDRRALSELIPRSPELMGQPIAPRDKLELKLVQMWEALLNRKPIGIQDNFFELGGNSMFIIRFLNQLEKPCPDEGRKLALDLAPATIFRHPTIEELANFIKSQP